MGPNTPHADSTEPDRQPALGRRTFLGATGALALLPGLTGAGRTAPTSATSMAPGDIPLEEYLETPGMVGENQEPAHVPTIPYASVESAVRLDREHDSPRERWEQSPYVRSLNGEWQFTWSLNPETAPDDFDAVEEWDEITVPRTWQSEGYGHSMYRNVAMDLWPYDPPNVPDVVNPVGTYRRTFTVPGSHARGRRNVLRFDGVKAAYFVWVNGEYVGYDEGSMTAAEFDVTDAVESGKNTVSVQVFRWSSGSYLENQDMWHWAGIYRDVTLYSTPLTHLRDYAVRTNLDCECRDATLSVDAEVANYGCDAADYIVRATLYDPDDREVTSFEAETSVSAMESARVTLEQAVSDPAKWSAERPALYRLGLELFRADEQSSPMEAQLERVGFREYDVSDGQVHVNGEQVEFRGVNLHEHHPEFGRQVPTEARRENFRRAKEFNVNAFRTAHYPRGPEFYEFADEFGIYVQDEVNAETHNNVSLVDDYPAFRESFLDRFRRMVQQNKNHASVFMWSTGNEAGLGPAHFDMADYAAEVDPTRLLYHQANNGGVAPYADVAGPRYVSPDELAGMATDGDEQRPIVMGEYSHAMGNSLGLMEPFWETIAEYPQLQGGFVWDWVNQELTSNLVVTPDASGTGNDGVLHGNPTVVTDDGGVRTERFSEGQTVEGSGLALSGLDDWVELYRDPSLDVTEPGLTLEVEVKPRDPWTGAEPFLTKGDFQYALKMADEETIQFFVYDTDDEWVDVNAPVPDDWTDSWHHVAGVHTGSELRLYVDGEQVGSTPHEGTIQHNHTPVAVGRNVDVHRDDTNTWLSNAVYRRAAVYDTALSEAELGKDRRGRSGDAVLWLDFAEFSRTGTFRTYGVAPFCCNGTVDADRDPQPEMWELKKAHQPVAVDAVDLADGTVSVTNEHDFTDLGALDATWELLADGETLQSGSLDVDLAPGETGEVTVPFETPDLEPGASYWLTVRFETATDRWWADAGHEVAFEQFEVPFDVPEPSLAAVSEMPALSVNGGD